MNDKGKLFDEFPENTEKEWIEKVEKDLKGNAFEELFWEINKNIKIAPFYHSTDNPPHVPNNKTNSNSWEIGEDIFVDNPEYANRQLLQALDNGVNAPRFVIENHLDEQQLNVLFRKVELSYISVHFLLKKAGYALPFLKCLYKFLSENGIEANEIKGSLNHDDGPSPELFQFAATKFPGFKIMTIIVKDASPAEIATSLAASILMAQDFLATLNESGISPKTTNNHLQFSVPVGKSYFVEIAKFRAFKILWANILEAYGLKGSKIPTIEAHISPDSFSEDANTNMIRSTTQAMSAVLGGVNRLNVLPSDVNSGASTDFSRRIARNVQHLLMMESFLDRVIDPANGSYYIETLTKKIAEAAWLEFQQSKKVKQQ